MAWPATPEALTDEQERLARARPEPFRLVDDLIIGACFACGPIGLEGAGDRGDPLFVGAALVSAGRTATVAIEVGAGAPYEPGLLALREGPALEAAVLRLPRLPDVLLVNATGRDHPRRAGLALHLGAQLGVASVGVTHRPLLAVGSWPGDDAGDSSPLLLEGEPVAAWVRTRPGTRPLVVHAAWGTRVEDGVAVVMRTVRRARTPEPLRLARRAARRARAREPG